MNRDEQEIRQVVATWMEATKSGDSQAVLDLMTDDAVFLVAGQPPMLGKAAFAAAAQPQSIINQTRPEINGSSDIQEIKIFDDWAYMWSRLTVVVTPAGGTTINRAGHTLTIFNKQSGKWLLARDANMLAPAPAAEK